MKLLKCNVCYGSGKLFYHKPLYLIQVNFSFLTDLEPKFEAPKIEEKTCWYCMGIGGHPWNWLHPDEIKNVKLPSFSL